MIPALLIGRGGSTGYPGKNTSMILGRKVMEYPILAAQNSKYINQDHLYISTDADDIMEIGMQHGFKPIIRPPELATNEALAEDAFNHGFKYIQESNKAEIEMIVLLFCNGVTITPGIIDKGVEALRADISYDCACTSSCYNMWSPLRAKRIEDGQLKPFIPFEHWSDVSCDRGSQGDVWYADCSAFVCRPQCLKPGWGDLPFRWMGRKVLPLKQWGGLDLDYKWQVGQAEFWLAEHGFTENKTPYDG